MTTTSTHSRPHRPGWAGRLRHALAVQEQLWQRYLAAPVVSGSEARAALGEPPLRWSRGRLRGAVLPGRD